VDWEQEVAQVFHATQAATRRRKAAGRALPPSDEEGDSEDLLQCTWNALIADFVGAVRNNDQTLHKQPDLPTLTDGLRTEQVIAAARQSNAARRWIDIGE
jgi:predicted dehydrogenase